MLSHTQNEDNNDILTSQWQAMLNVFESQWNEIITKPITVSTNHVNALLACDKHLQGIINTLVQGVAQIKNNHVKYYNGSSNNMFDEFTSKKIAELELMKPSERRGVNVNSSCSGNNNMKQQRTFLKQNDNDNNDYQSNCNKVTIDDLIIQQQQQMKPKQKLQHVFESVGETIPSGVFSNNSSKRNGGVKKKRHLFLSNDNNNNNNNNINCNNNHNKYNNSISNLNTQQHNRHKSFLKEDEPKIVKKKKTMAADKIGLHPLNTTTTTNHPPIIKTTTTTTNIKHSLITHTSPNNTGSKSERSSKIRKKIQHNTQLISEMMKLNNK